MISWGPVVLLGVVAGLVVAIVAIVALSGFGRWNVPDVCPNRQFLDRVADHKARADGARIFSGWR